MTKDWDSQLDTEYIIRSCLVLTWPVAIILLIAYTVKNECNETEKYTNTLQFVFTPLVDQEYFPATGAKS